jgi:hypothetical protein
MATNLLEKHAASRLFYFDDGGTIFLSTKLHCVISWKMIILIFTAVRTSDLKRIKLVFAYFHSVSTGQKKK